MKLLSIPFNQGSLGKSPATDKAPKAIIEALKEIYINESGRKPVFDQHEIVFETSNIEEAHDKIFETTRQLQPQIILGGDHAITYSTFKAMKTLNPNLGLVMFDAHPDTMQSFKPATHENFLRCLVEDKIIDPSKIILIGIRAWDAEEKQFLEEHNIRYFPMKQIAQEEYKEICFTVMEQLRQWESIYVSIDIDALDPAFAPGTGYLEPGGMSTRELLFFIQKLKLLPNIKCLDLVEVNPDKDINGLTAKTGAKIITEFC